MTKKSGRHFLQIPGPTNVPQRVLRALSRSTIDHRSDYINHFALIGPPVDEVAQEDYLALRVAIDAVHQLVVELCEQLD